MGGIIVCTGESIGVGYSPGRLNGAIFWGSWKMSWSGTGSGCIDTVRHYAKLTIQDLKETHARCHPREKGG